MHSFKSKFLSAWACAVPIFAAVLPRDHSVGRLDGRTSLVDLDVHEGYAQATFNVPCAGCLGGDDDAHEDDESLLLSFRTLAAEEPCGTSSNITVNGVYLPQQWSDNRASGDGSIYSSAVATQFYEKYGSVLYHLDLEWESACLHADSASIATDDGPNVDDATPAQVLTVSIKSVNGKRPHRPAGFTLSFTQNPTPELLRFEAIPNYTVANKENAESWRSPPQHLRLIPSTISESPHVDESSDPYTLEHEIAELKALQLQAEEIHKAIIEKEDRIAKAEFSHCASIPCVCKSAFKVLRQKPKAAWRLSLQYMGIRPQTPVMGRPEEETSWRPQATVAAYIQTTDSTPSTYSPFSSGSAQEKASEKQRSSRQFLAIALGILGTVLCCGGVVITIKHRCAARRSATKIERHGSSPSLRRTRKSHWRSWLHRRSAADQGRIEDYDEKRRLINSQEDILEDAMQEEIRQLRHAHGIVDSLVQGSRLSREGNPPVTYAYHAHTNYHGHNDPPPPPTSSPYETAGTRTYDVSAFTYPHPVPHSPTSHYSTYPPSSGGFPSRPLSRSSTNSSLPGYASSHGTAPPAYQTDEEDMAERVANGFHNYRPRGRGSSMGSNDSRWTPDSSVVDVSPRRSAETLRFAYVEFEDVERAGKD